MSLTVKSEKDAFTCKLFTVKEMAVSLPDGKEKVYDLVDIQNAITILPIDDEGNVCFVEQFRIGARKNLLELPAGKIEKGEDPQVTAQRELREETGMDAKEIKQIGSFYMTPGYANEYMYCFLATGLYTSPLIPDEDEFIHLRKVPLSSIYEMIHNGQIEDSKTLAVFLLAEKTINFKTK